jgi:hypothetical protein
MLDVSWGHLMDYFGSDPNTKTIIIQMSCVGDARSHVVSATTMVENYGMTAIFKKLGFKL